MMRTLNVPMLRKGVDWVMEQNELADEDREWDQESWAFLDRPARAAMAAQDRHDPMCCTSMCFAGYVAYITGWTFEFPNGLRMEGAEVARKDGRVDSIATIAKRELGITDEQGDSLFNASNDADDIRYIAEVIVMEAGDRL